MILEIIIDRIFFHRGIVLIDSAKLRKTADIPSRRLNLWISIVTFAAAYSFSDSREIIMRALFYTIILLVITGCSYSSVQQEALDEAQLLMDDDPAAALSKLDDIDISEIRDSATMARWALLYSEAMVINRLSAPADTIVNIAIDYYGRHRQQNEYQKASRLKSLITSGKADNQYARL